MDELLHKQVENVSRSSTLFLVGDVLARYLLVTQHGKGKSGKGAV